jgi:hypothetical protein
VEADRHIRELLGLALDDESKRIGWGELNDALTSMRAHGKAIPESLGEEDLALINRLVRRIQI